MSLLVETIKIENGKVLNIDFHNERMIRSLYMIYGIRSNLSLYDTIMVPDAVSKGICKCRVIYDYRSVKIEFLPYSIRKVNSLKLVICNDICYPYKYTDRTKLISLFEMRGECDDIIIVKNGFVTDSSYSNLIFRDKDGEWITPSTYLLPGTKRAYLLGEKKILERELFLNDIKMYTEVRLINAMINIEDTSGIPVENIY